MSTRVDGTDADQTPVATPDRRALEAYGIQADLRKGRQVLLIGDPEAAAYAVVGTPAELRLFALRVLGTVLGLARAGGLLPGPSDELGPNDPPSPARGLLTRLIEEAELGGCTLVSDYWAVAGVEVTDSTGKFMLACVPVDQ